jgi:cardiolipin hydrolase
MKRFAAASLSSLVLIIAANFYFHRFHSPPKTGRPVAVVTAPAAGPIQGPYFSDGDRVADRVVAAVNSTERSLEAAIYDLTEPAITAAIARARQRGINIRIVADEGQAWERHSQIPYLKGEGILVRLGHGYRGSRSIMHDKFAIFDGRRVVTGSFNWTTSADRYNYENAIFISDPAAVLRYQREFERIWEAAAGG